jgi:hypothetical protein
MIKGNIDKKNKDFRVLTYTDLQVPEEWKTSEAFCLKTSEMEVAIKFIGKPRTLLQILYMPTIFAFVNLFNTNTGI